jgi:hypothetical protein
MQTPPDRDRYANLLRVVSIGLVILVIGSRRSCSCVAASL